MWNDLPNLLTLARIAAIPALVAAFFVSGTTAPWVALAIFAAAAITDWFDGWVARTWNQQSALGRFLDPIADKLLVAATILLLVAEGNVEGFHVIAALVILMREITVSGLREFLAEVQVRVPVTRLAKWKTAVQLAALAVLIVAEVAPPGLHAETLGLSGLWLAAVLTIYTGYDYLRAGVAHMTGRDPDAKNPAGPAARTRTGSR